MTGKGWRRRSVVGRSAAAMAFEPTFFTGYEDFVF